MMKWIYFGVVALFFLGCQSTAVPEGIQQGIEQIKAEYAPDKRVAWFDVDARMENDQLILTGETNLPQAKAALDSLVAAANLNTVDSVTLLPAADLQGSTYGVVRLSVSNIRSQPKHSAELATQATLGTPLRVWKKQDNWYWVQTPDGYLGWLDAGGFTSMDQAAYAQWQSLPKAVFLPEYGFAHEKANPYATPVSDLLAGNILAVAAQDAGFTQVRYPDGRTAYVASNQLMSLDAWLASRSPSVDNILSTAHQMLGRPYLWGGTSGKGVDCSGFTKTVFFLNGLMLPRDASQQVHTGVDIPTDTTLQNLVPGDFLFFGRKATSDQTEKITHVAIYLGEGKIIHSAGIVQIESLRRGDPDFNEYRLNTMVRAKRMLDEVGKNGVQWVAEVPMYAAK